MERKLIAAAVSSALALPMAAQAVEFSAYGQVTRAIISLDGGGPLNGADGYDGELQHMDDASSGSRFGFRGSEELDSGMTVGVNLEYGVSANLRQAHVTLSSAGGTITVGHGSAAADGMAHADLGGLSFLGSVTNFCSYSSSHGPACSSQDGTRHAGLRYDTPAIGPAQISLSSADDEYLDAKLSIAGSMGDAGYDLRIGHIAEYDVVEGGSEVDKGDLTTMSAAFSFGQGTSVAAAWSQQDTGNEIEYRYLKLDHSYGAGSIGVHYKTGEYGAGDNKGVDGSTWGVGIGHGLGGGAAVYAGYRHIEEDGMKDIDLILAGMRVQFN